MRLYLHPRTAREVAAPNSAPVPSITPRWAGGARAPACSCGQNRCIVANIRLATVCIVSCSAESLQLG
eukprot:6147447-Pyramimonas_sp.AAC.1